MFSVYIIKSNKFKWYYVGSTGNLIKRFDQHNRGEVRSTKFRLPYTLVYHETHNTLEEARNREKEIKRNRILKEGIIRKLASSSNG